MQLFIDKRYRKWPIGFLVEVGLFALFVVAVAAISIAAAFLLG